MWWSTTLPRTGYDAREWATSRGCTRDKSETKRTGGGRAPQSPRMSAARGGGRCSRSSRKESLRCPGGVGCSGSEPRGRCTARRGGRRADREDRQILRTLVMRGVGLGCQVQGRDEHYGFAEVSLERAEEDAVGVDYRFAIDLLNGREYPTDLRDIAV